MIYRCAHCKAEYYSLGEAEKCCPPKRSIRVSPKAIVISLFLHLVVLAAICKGCL